MPGTMVGQFGFEERMASDTLMFIVSEWSGVMKAAGIGNMIFYVVISCMDVNVAPSSHETSG
jgi:hypothetical protein